MAKVFETESGRTFMPNKDDVEVVANRQAPLDQAHPDPVGKFSREYILADAQEA
jgi:hypothetical protein